MRLQLQTSVSIILALAVSSTTGKCWYTDCQPNGLDITGCSPYGNETGTPPLECRGARGIRGIQYHCCSSNNNGMPSNETVIYHFVTFKQFQEALTKNGYKTPSPEQYNNFHKYARPLGGILDVEESAMVLAHIIYESDGLVRKQDKVPNRVTFASRCILPDEYYGGKGYIKLAGCNNYFIASEAIFGDFRLHEDPIQVSQNDTVSWATSLYIWGELAHFSTEVQQGKFGASTKLLSENECNNKNDASAKKRFKIYGVVRQAFGLPGMGDPSGCSST